MKTITLARNGKPITCKGIDGRVSIKEIINSLPTGCKNVAGIIKSNKRPIEKCPECLVPVTNNYCGSCKNRHN